MCYNPDRGHLNSFDTLGSNEQLNEWAGTSTPPHRLALAQASIHETNIDQEQIAIQQWKAQRWGILSRQLVRIIFGGYRIMKPANCSEVQLSRHG